MRNTPTVGERRVGRLLVLCAALLWSTSGLFVRAPLFDDWPSETRGALLAFWRSAMAGLILAPMIRRPRFHRLLPPLVIAFLVMTVTYLTAIVRTSPANAIWLQNAAPFWVFLLGVFVFREGVRPQDFVPLILGLLGVGIILGFEVTRSTPDQLGLLCGIVAGVAYAAVLTLMNRVSHLDPAWVVALNQIFTAAVLLPWFITCATWPSPGQLAALAAFGALQLGLPYLMILRGLRVVSAQEAVAIGLVEPVVMPLWVYLAWGVTAPWWTFVGAVLILSGLVMRYFVLGDGRPVGPSDG